MKPLLFIFCLLVSYFPAFSQISSKARLVWSDEFDSDGLPSAEKWSYEVGDHGWGNNERQFYTQMEAKNARVTGGMLVIEAHQDLKFPKGYSSARLVTKEKGAWEYGYVEVRAKLPRGRGTWPAIWMLPLENRYGGWPMNGEIDIMEYVGYDPGRVHGTVHTEAFNHLKGTQKGGQEVLPALEDGFHTYAIDWKQDRIDFFIDGKKYFTFSNSGKGSSEWPFDQPFYLLLNLAVGGNWGGKEGIDESIWPQQFLVDYVRVYDHKPE